jgi:hypothetical protein
MKMANEASSGNAKKTAAKKAGEVIVEKEESQFECVDCPVVKAFGLCKGAGLDLKSLNISDFLAHVAGARREFLLGMKSILEGAIRLEEERIERRQAASAKKKQNNKEQLRHISIE